MSNAKERYHFRLCGCCQVVRPQLPKLVFAGSSPVTRSRGCDRHLQKGACYLQNLARAPSERAVCRECGRERFREPESCSKQDDERPGWRKGPSRSRNFDNRMRHHPNGWSLLHLSLPTRAGSALEARCSALYPARKRLGLRERVGRNRMAPAGLAARARVPASSRRSGRPRPAQMERRPATDMNHSTIAAITEDFQELGTRGLNTGSKSHRIYSSLPQTIVGGGISHPSSIPSPPRSVWGALSGAPGAAISSNYSPRGMLDV